MLRNMRDKMLTIAILEKTKSKVKALAKDRGLKDVTTLEYLLNGKIPLEELNKYENN